MIASVVVLLLSGVTPKGQAATGVYYVDRVAGSDSAAGTSPRTAWKTMGRVSAAVLAPGDSVLLRRGQTWSGRLTVRSSGTATAPISIGAYGTGERPVLNVRPRPDSQAVDFGTTAYADVDLDGDPVGLDGHVEAGAYELTATRR